MSETPYLLNFLGPVFGCFLIGSIPFELWFEKIFKGRPLSQSWGKILLFSLNVLKGVISVLMTSQDGFRFFTEVFFGSASPTPSDLNTHLAWVSGFFSVLGHCFSPWLNFRGGKGVAVALGVVLVLTPISALFGIVGYALAFASRGSATFAAISGVLLAMVALFVLSPNGLHLGIGGALVLIILIRHEGNIDALLENAQKKN